MNQELYATLTFVGLIFCGLIVAGCIYLTSNIRDVARLLDRSLRSFGEADGERYRSNFAHMLWQEKKTEMEKELTAYKRAHERASRELIELTERFNGVEQAYREAREELNASGILLGKAQAEENAKKKRKKKSDLD